MNENRHPIDDLFRDGLNQHSLEAPMHVWERIDQTRTPVYKLLNNFKQNSRWYLSVAAGLVLMSSAAIMFLTDAPESGLADGTGNMKAPAQKEFASGGEKTNSAPNGAAMHTESNSGTESISSPSSNPKLQTQGVGHNEFTGSEDEFNPTHGQQSPQTGGRSELPVYREFGTEKQDPDKGKGKVFVPDYHSLPVIAAPEEAPSEIHAVAPSQVVPSDEIKANPEVDEQETETAVQPVIAPPSAPEQNLTPAAPPKEASKWALELLGSYDFINRRMQDANPDYIQARKESEKIGAAYTIQLRAQYRLSEILSLRSGISFSQHHEKLNFTHSESYTEIEERQETGYILDPINGPTPITYTVKDTFHYNSTTSVNSDNSYTFIDIPVLLNYSFYTSNKWSLGVSGGPVFNLAFYQKGQILGPVNNEIIDLNSSANPFRSYAGVNLMMNLSAAYKISNQFDLLFEPGLRYGVSSLTNKNFGINQKYSSVNLFTGIRYRF